MIRKLERTPSIPSRILKKIRKNAPFKGGDWDLKQSCITEFKALIKAQLKIIQSDKCAYCGLPIGETSRFEIEHIAPKGGPARPQYVQYTFTKMNLVLACNLCNCTEKKGTYDTIANNPVNKDYTQNQFKIVHPYIDDHALHYSWPAGQNSVLIQGITDKGHESIKLFELDSSKHSEARAKVKIFEALKSNPKGIELINSILGYNPI